MKPLESSTGKGTFDPRASGAAVDMSNVDMPLNSYFERTGYSGAFAPTGNTWLEGWSYLDCVQGVLASTTDVVCTDPNDNFTPYKTGILIGIAAAHKSYGSRC